MFVTKRDGVIWFAKTIAGSALCLCVEPVRLWYPVSGIGAGQSERCEIFVRFFV